MPFFLLLLFCSAQGYRMGDVDTVGTEGYVFVQSSGLFWGQGELGALMHGARFVDISNRGVRVISAGTPRALSSSPQPCTPCPEALCCSADGMVFPQTPGPFVVNAAGQPNNACGRTGGARRAYMPNSSQYTVTACDVLQSDVVVVFDVVAEVFYRTKNTYGPLSYVLALACMLSCLVGMSTSSSHRMHVAAACCGAVSTTLLVSVHSLFFATTEDLCMLWVPFALHGVCVAVWATQPLLDKASEAAQQAYFYSICVLTTASYRTAENPYAAVLCLYLLVKLAQHVLSKQGEGCLITACVAVYLGLLVEYGLVPQFSQEASWPLYAGAICLVVTVACAAWST